MLCPSSQKVSGRNELRVALLGGQSAELRFGVSNFFEMWCCVGVPEPK
jgi:hypothetical protein